jgi:hypothetical protein
MGKPVEGFVKKYTSDGPMLRAYWHDEVANIRHWTRPWTSVSVKSLDEEAWNANKYARAAKEILISELLATSSLKLALKLQPFWKTILCTGGEQPSKIRQTGHSISFKSIGEW